MPPCVEKWTVVCGKVDGRVWRSGRLCVEKWTALCGEVYDRMWRGGRLCVEKWTAVCGEVDGRVWRSGRPCVERWTAVCEEVDGCDARCSLLSPDLCRGLDMEEHTMANAAETTANKSYQYIDGT